jgi:hypothetical protein
MIRIAQSNQYFDIMLCFRLIDWLEAVKRKFYGIEDVSDLIYELLKYYLLRPCMKCSFYLPNLDLALIFHECDYKYESDDTIGIWNIWHHNYHLDSAASWLSLIPEEVLHNILLFYSTSHNKQIK